MALAAADPDTEVQADFFPMVRRYRSGRVERFMNMAPVPAGADPATGVASKDVVVDPATGVWARLFLPPGTPPGKKLPVVVYYHGGAYVVGSAADPFTHSYLNALAAEAGVERVEERGPVDARAVQSACLLCPFDSLPTLLVGGRDAGGAFRAGARRRW